MVMAKLHIICGNCGQNDMFEYEIVVDSDFDKNDIEYEYQRVSICCRNCNTIHSLDDNAEDKTLIRIL